MPAPTLRDLTIRACTRNIHAIDDFGSVPLHLCIPLLSRVKSPTQLLQIERNHESFRGAITAPMWQAFIARDIPDWEKKNYAPKDDANWNKVYKRYVREQEEEVARDAEKLRKQFEGLKKEKEAKRSEVVDVKNARVPRTRPPRLGGPRRPEAKDILSIARREARGLMEMRRGAKAALNRGPGRSAVANRQAGLGVVKTAPKSMVEEYRTKTLPQFRVRPPGKGKAIVCPNEPTLSSFALLDDREERLRALQSGGKRNSASVNYKEGNTHAASPPLRVSDLEDLEDLFGDPGDAVATSPVPHSKPAPLQALPASKPKPLPPPPPPGPPERPQTRPLFQPATATRADPPPSSASLRIDSAVQAAHVMPRQVTKRKKEVDIFARPRKRVC